MDRTRTAAHPHSHTPARIRGALGRIGLHWHPGRAACQPHNGLIFGTRNYPPLGNQLGPRSELVTEMETDARGASLGGGAGLTSRALGFAGGAGGSAGGREGPESRGPHGRASGAQGTDRQGGATREGRGTDPEGVAGECSGDRLLQAEFKYKVGCGVRGLRWGAVSRPAQRLCVHTASGWALPFPWRPGYSTVGTPAGHPP